MGNTCACIRPAKEVLASPMGGSTMVETTESGEASSIAEHIESSIYHWSEGVESFNLSNDEIVADNKEVFQTLQMHPKWGSFFKTFFEADLVLGMKFAEGVQVELHDVQIDWRNPADRGKRSIIEEQIERSKGHWTQLAQPDSGEPDSGESDSGEPDSGEPGSSGDEEEAAEVSNRVVFEDLQKQSTFFYTFEKGEMVMAKKKFAEGSQAELYHAQIKWRTENWRKLLLREGEGDDVLEDPSEYVLKVFKKGTFLEQLEKTLPQAMLEFHAERVRAWMTRRYTCDVVCGTLLEDGRFAFVLQREDADLRNLIDRNMAFKTGQDSKREGARPFPKQVAENFMYEIALGTKWLHDQRIVHRDLKASNVLVRLHDDWNYCFVADYECSVGVDGTGFWRAPEILQSFKDAENVRDFAGKQRCRSEREKLFTKEADVYSYGMTCYEILTGKFPFEDHPGNICDLILKGQRTDVPTYVDRWAHDLLNRCWEFKPEDRASFEEILKRLRENSEAIQSHISTDENRAHPEAFDWGYPKTEKIPLAELKKLCSGKRKQQILHAKEVKAQVNQRSQFDNEYEPRNRLQSDWVIKIFKRGTSLRDLQLQWPQGLFELHVDRRERAKIGPTPEWKKPKYICDILCGTLLEDGRFGFLIAKEQEDLRSLIDYHCSTTLGWNQNCGPFPKEVAEKIMHHIALGMDWLHTYDIVHRDLKASNVLVNKGKDGSYQCHVADFDCSIGTIGTGFFRAPEILQAVQNGVLSQIPEVVSKNADVYSYGMTCYEISTGKVPFEGRSRADYDHVLKERQRPEVPEYVDGWVRELLSRCWDEDPSARPSFVEILELFELHMKTSEENPRRDSR